MEKKNIHMIGNTHIDPVWLWQKAEGMQEVKSSFASTLDRLDEFPDFKFTQSSISFLAWMKENCPEQFERIRARVAEGRWEIVGGMWVEPDCDLPSGEALIRHFLYSKKFVRENFDKDVVTAYNVDSFGHGSNMPAICSGCGIRYYLMSRPDRKHVQVPPVFTWRSKDGSSVIAERTGGEYMAWTRPALEWNLSESIEALEEHGYDRMAVFYGVGNHGGGPTKENIQSIYALNDREDMPVMEMGTTARFFQSIRENGREYPEYIGDLQHHASGCYSVLSKVKRENRRAEDKLIQAEMWSAIANVTEHQPYPKDFEEAWKGVLFNQFHDILAGTSIPSAYDDASYLYGQAMAVGQKNLNYAVQAISWDIDIEEDVTMKPIVVFNAHAWCGKMVIDLEVRGLSDDNFKLTDASGNKIPAQRIRSEATVNGQSRLLFVAELPSMGYEVFRLYLKAEDAPRFPHVKVTDNMLENARYRISFDEATGYLASLYDKQSDLEVLRREGARLAVIEDLSDTWSHNIFKFDKHLGDMKAVSRTVLEDGPVRSTVRIKYKYNTSYVVQDFRLYSELDYVEVRVRVDWREPQTILKIKYPVNFNFRKPTYEIPYGYIEKSANGEEEPGQTWFDFSGEHFQKGVMYGLAIANNAKYSYSFDVDEMNLTVLKNSVYAHHDPKKLEDGVEYEFVDDGIQEFMYMLLPHTGGWKDSEIVKHARELNQKPVTIIETFHKGSLPARNSFLSMESDNVVISAMKEAEDGDGVIIRAYETKRQASQALLKIPFLNREETLSFAPCEIKTVKLPYDHSAPVMEVNLLEM